jgi:putative hydroxymethylpyrimidine transport system substrate-binding protein
MRLRVLALAGLASLLAGCGERREIAAEPAPAPFRVALGPAATPEQAGIYAANANGDFTRAGMTVSLHQAASGTAALDELAAGGAELAVASEPEVFLARDHGPRLVAIAALVQGPLESIVSLSPLKKLSQLEGKKVATAGLPLQSAELDSALRSAGVAPSSVHHVRAGADLARALNSHRADAALGATWNYDTVRLERRHQHPSVLRLTDIGIPTYYESVLVVREAQARHQGARLRAFLQALTRGEQAARADPERAGGQLPGLDRATAVAALRRTLSAAFPGDPRLPFGYEDPRSWREFGSWMLAHALLTRPPDATLAVTDEFLPGQGE